MSKIEWTEKTWNPLIGCSIESAGCTNCYAIRDAYRKNFNKKVPQYAGLTVRTPGKPAVWTGIIRRNSNTAFYAPKKWREGKIIFVNSMSDLFHPEADKALVEEIIGIMLTEERHIFQVLTKRPSYAATFLKERGISLPRHVWIGTSVENMKVTDRIDALRTIPAKVRFLSLEPMIGSLGILNLIDIHWVISGGESGPGARFCDPEWIREVRDQCVGLAIPFFHKQNGSNPQNFATVLGGKPKGESKGGNLLDGMKWLQYPATGHSLDRPSMPPLRLPATATYPTPTV